MIDAHPKNSLPAPDTALILCTDTPHTQKTLLGLTVGSRILHILARSGVRRVLCVGEGPIPHSERAQIEVTKWHEGLQPPKMSEFLLLPSDLVFSPRLLGESPAFLGSYPIRRLSRDKFLEIANNPGHWIEELGQGDARQRGTFAIRLNSKSKKKKARRALLNSLRKDIDGFISSHLNRHISIFITQFLVRTAAPPNVLTLLFTLIGIAAAVVVALANQWWAFILAGFLLQAQSVLDGCDGEIARLTFRFSKSGQWLDTIGDDITNYLFCLGLAINQAHAEGWNWLYILGGVTLAFQCITTAILYRRLIQWGTGDLLAVPDTLTRGQITGPMGKILAVLGVIRKRDFFVFLVSIITALKFPLVSFALIAIGTYASFVGILINDIRISKQIKAGTFDRT